MYSLTDLKKGTFIQLDGDLYQVIDYQHTQLGRGGAIVRTKLKNLQTGASISKTFKGNDKITPARLERADVQYLYQDGARVYLMDRVTYDQFDLSKANIGEQLQWLSEGSEVVALRVGGQVVGLEIPPKLKLKVVKTEPGVRGDTSSAPTKLAEVESGASLQVPLFIKPGEVIVIDSRSGSYKGRA